MPREDLAARVQAARALREAAHRRRHLRTVTRRAGVVCTVDGRDLLNFCSNDYLGLSQHPRVIAALRDAAGEGSGAGASHLVCWPSCAKALPHCKTALTASQVAWPKPNPVPRPCPQAPMA